MNANSNSKLTLNEYPSYPHASGRMGLQPMIVLGVGIPFILLLWLLHACGFVVGGVVVVCVCLFVCVVVVVCVCFWVFVFMWCEFFIS